MKIYFYETFINNLPLSVLAIRLRKTKKSFERCYRFVGTNCCYDWASDGTFINVKTQGGGCERARIGDWIIQYVRDEVAYEVYSNKEFKKEFKKTNRYMEK